MPLKYRKTPSWLAPMRRGLVDLIPTSLMRRVLYRSTMGSWGNFAEPQTFNEKVNWRIMNDRRDRIIHACDMLRMKEMARTACPGPDLRIPETYWSGTDLCEAPDLAAMPPWILKPNHSSGRVMFGPDPHSDVDRLRGEAACWMTETPVELGEWGYGQARPQLLIEECIPTPDGRPPADYKFFVFDGRVELVQVNRGRFGPEQTATFMDADWRPMPVCWLNQPVADEERPPELDKMLMIASALGAGWDFIRIDLYAVDGEVWFGEYTPYPGSGMRRYRPDGFDLEQGRHWILPSLDDVQRGRP